MEIGKTITFRNGAIELHPIPRLLTDRHFLQSATVLVCFQTLKMQIGANFFIVYWS